MVKRAWFAGLFLAAGLLVVGCASSGAGVIYFETDWQPRELTPAEIDGGLTRARVRILIQGRRGAADLFRMEFLGENEGLRVGMSTWEKIDLIDEVERGLREVYDDLKMEMRVGIITR